MISSIRLKRLNFTTELWRAKNHDIESADREERSLQVLGHSANDNSNNSNNNNNNGVRPQSQL